MTSSIIKIALLFFLSNRTCRTGLSRFGKLTFPKSADSQFLKTVDCDYSEICRNKVTAYIFNEILNKLADVDVLANSCNILKNRLLCHFTLDSVHANSHEKIGEWALC